MEENRSAVICPHCGAENPRSLLVTMCQQCRGDLSQAEAQPPAPARSASARSPVPAAPRKPSAPVLRAAELKSRTPELPPVAPEAPRPRASPDERVSRLAAYEMKPVPPGFLEHRDEPRRDPRDSPTVGIVICLLAIALFGIGFAVVLWLTE